MKGVTIWTLQGLLNSVDSCSASHDGKNYYPARPLGWTCIQMRFRAAWMAFTGRADVVTWPQGQ